MSSEKDNLPPPPAGQPIRAAYLAQEHRRGRRNGVVAAPPLFTRQVDAGTLIGARLPTFHLAYTTTAVGAATYSGANITSFGSGSAHLYEPTATGANVNSDKAIAVLQVGKTSIASGTTVLVYPIFGEELGLFGIGKVCEPVA